MGGGAFKPRPLELEGVEGYENIHYHVSNIQQYAGKKVTILGGGDSAVDWALALKKLRQLPLFTAEIISCLGTQCPSLARIICDHQDTIRP